MTAAAARTTAAPEFAWIESENPTTEPAFRPAGSDKGYTIETGGKRLSGGKLLSVTMDEGHVNQRVPPEGVVIVYDFDVRSAGNYQVWNRIGLEWVRSDFEWRVDNGDWRTLRKTEPTTDLVPLGVWSEIAWIRLGDAPLSPGRHRLEIRLKTDRNDDGKPQLRYRSDALCIAKDGFQPNFAWKPGADHRDEQARKAADTVFTIKLGYTPAARTETPLTGLWQIARWDEQGAVKPEERLTIPEALPADLNQRPWYGLAVPGSRNALLPEWGFCHRYICRTKVRVPDEAQGRGFFLDFQNFNMIAGVFVNGRKCGWSKAFSTAWQCDITPAVRPGAVNEIAVVFKDAYYGFPGRKRPDTLETDPLGARKAFNLPLAWLGGNEEAAVAGKSFITQLLDMPVAADTRTGLLEPVTLVVAGAPYTADVFAKPSVKRKELALEIAVKNPGAQPVTVKLQNEVVPWNGGKGGAAEKKFAPREITLQPGEELTTEQTEPWAAPRLWWPDDPQLYWVITKLSRGGTTVDIACTRFGFREWAWDSTLFKLNGVNWPLWANLDAHASATGLVALAQLTGQNMMRLWRTSGQDGMTMRDTLNYYDEHGLNVRRSGIFDGQMGQYQLVIGGQPDQNLWDHWVGQMQAWVRAERNHPAIFIWSVENEIVYINSKNWGHENVWEPATTRAIAAVKRADPTRPFMVDGGRALKDQSLEVNGCHYEEGSGIGFPRDYPDAAYSLDAWYSVPHRGTWPMKRNAPIFLGENFFAAGYTPAQLAGVGGEQAFAGMTDAQPAMETFARMLYEGNRWAGVAAQQCWFALPDPAGRAYVPAWQPVAVLCRQWNWTFNGGREIARTLRVFNHTRSADTIEIAWHLKVNGRTADEGRRAYSIPAGETETSDVRVQAPAVSDRTPAEFVVTASRGGKEVFRQVHPAAILKPDAAPAPALAAGELCVWDPYGSVKRRLSARKVPFVEAAALDQAPAAARVILVGKDAVPAEAAADPAWQARAALGARLLVLEQRHPLRGPAVPADFEPSDRVGRIAFAEDLSHPIFAGLAQPDFFTWSGDHVVYRGALKKATRGARSLAQCDEELGYSALVESQVGQGTMLLCQMAVGEKLEADPVAQRLFDNALNYAAAYRPVRKATALGMNPGDRRAAVYAREWANPRPDAAVASVDVVRGPDGERRGDAALPAIAAVE